MADTNILISNLISKSNVVYIEDSHKTLKSDHLDSKALALSLNANLMSNGFILSKSLFESIATLEPGYAKVLCMQIEMGIKHKIGNDVEYIPFYPNFPEQVICASDSDLFLNALSHYWSYGQWIPRYEKNERLPYNFSDTEFKTIKEFTATELENMIVNMLGSNDNLPEEDIEIIEYIWDNSKSNLIFKSIKKSALDNNTELPNKELMAKIVAKDLSENTIKLAKSATDILRICTVLSGGKPNLLGNIKFKSLKRSYRKIIVNRLEEVINTDDINKNKKKWIKLFHNLHVGDFSDKVYNIAKNFRENLPVKTTKGEYAKLYNSGAYIEATQILINYPGDFARNLDSLLRNANEKQQIIILNNFFADNVIKKVSIRVLIQVFNHFSIQKHTSATRKLLKGGMAENIAQSKLIITKAGRARLYENNNKTIDFDLLESILTKIRSELNSRFVNKFGSSNRVYIDPALKNFKVPIGVANTPRGMGNLAQGTVLPMKESDIIRFFIYWVGFDLDLSVVLLDENYSFIQQLNWQNLRTLGMTHSGDITDAPNGASEFVDVDIKQVLQNPNKVRYLIPAVHVYDGGTFEQHQVCYFGWMSRDDAQKGEIYEPSSVEMKLEVDGKSRNMFPLVFDLITKEITIMNIYGTSMLLGGTTYRDLNVISKYTAHIIDKRNRMSLYDLFRIASSKSIFVNDKTGADYTYGVTEGDIQALDYNKIVKEYLSV